MQAVIAHAAGDLRVDTIPDAGAPGEGEVRVAISKGGICGSDLHYFRHGGIGTAIRLREPMILGHEVSGIVAEVGAGVSDFAPGDKVAINPSMPCGECVFCRRDMRNQCTDMRFFGSAMRFPHQQGLFRQGITLPAVQLIKLRPETDLAAAACSEPFAVALSAVRKAGSLLGQRVMVSGCGPIGCLMVLAAVQAGAAEVIATDLVASSLTVAAKMGAGKTIDLSQDKTPFDALKAGKGKVDVLFECSGSPVALASAFEVVRPRGLIVTVGMGADASLPLGLVVTKEIRIQGSFRFDEEFALSATMIDQGRVNVRPLISQVIILSEAVDAFNLAADRSRAMKVQLDFETA